jgi:hypothetical protein
VVHTCTVAVLRSGVPCPRLGALPLRTENAAEVSQACEVPEPACREHVHVPGVSALEYPSGAGGRHAEPRGVRVGSAVGNGRRIMGGTEARYASGLVHTVSSRIDVGL